MGLVHEMKDELTMQTIMHTQSAWSAKISDLNNNNNNHTTTLPDLHFDELSWQHAGRLACPLKWQHTHTQLGSGLRLLHSLSQTSPKVCQVLLLLQCLPFQF